jgi:hypothetical protein
MADAEISGLASLLGANVADGDLFPTVDISDTSMAGTGTTKKITAAELRIAMAHDLAALGIGTAGGGTFTDAGGGIRYATSQFFSDRVQSTDQRTYAVAIEDERVYSHDQTATEWGGAGLYVGVRPTLGVGQHVSIINGIQVLGWPQPTGSDTTSVVDEINGFACQMNGTYLGLATGVPLIRGALLRLSATAGHVGTAIGTDLTISQIFGDIVTGIGFRFQESSAVTTWGLQIGPYLSQHQGLFGLGGAAINTAPTYGLHMMATTGNEGSIFLPEVTTAPSNPPSSAGVVLHHKADKIAFAFNDGGTMRYLTATLSAGGGTWALTTSAP